MRHKNDFNQKQYRMQETSQGIVKKHVLLSVIDKRKIGNVSGP